MKVFVEEPDSAFVVSLLEEHAAIGSSVLAYVESRSALSRRHREGFLDTASHRRALRELEARWPHVTAVRIDDSLIREAGEIATASVLRAADAIHLASALRLVEGRPQQSTFICWDGRLWDAAEAAGFRMVPASRP